MRAFGRALVACVFAGACSAETAHDHSEAHPAGHDHHEDGHGHGGAVFRHTLWSEHYELFAEHPPVVVGRSTEFLAHLTWLDDFEPLEEGEVSLKLVGPAEVVAASPLPLRPGIYLLSFEVPRPGLYTASIRVEGLRSGQVGPFALEAFTTEAAAEAAAPGESDDEALIEFLKEQQWKVPFDTGFVRTGTLTPSVELSGRVRTPPQGQAVVGAPVAGRLVPPKRGLPSPWSTVREGEVLASLSPTPASPEASLRAELAVAETKARVQAARVALERAERLIVDQAIAQRELEDARREVDVAEASLAAARGSAELYTRASQSAGRGTWRLTAPISGTLASVDVLPGASVQPGQALFRIVDTSELWVVANVPEQDAGRLRTDRAAKIRLAGESAWRTLDLSGAPIVGRTVEERSRTVEVIYPTRSMGAALRVGGLVQVAVPVDDDFEGALIPGSAIIDRDGRSVVYVQVDGEHFEERTVRAAVRASGTVGTVGGLRVGERVVTEGAHLVRLAEGAKAGGGHGHIH